MDDNVLGKLREAREAICVELEQKHGHGSRELSIVMTHLETAILWREKDLRVNTGPINEAAG